MQVRRTRAQRSGPRWAATVIGAAIALGGCGPPPIASVRAEVEAIHEARRERAIREALEGTEPVELEPITVGLPPGAVACFGGSTAHHELPAPPEPPPTIAVPVGEGDEVAVDTCALAELVRRGMGKLSGRSAGGVPVTLVPAGQLDERGSVRRMYPVGRRPDGTHVVVYPARQESGERRRGYRPGSCDHMPDTSRPPPRLPSGRLYVFPGDVPVTLVGARYDAIYVELVCDQNEY